jgi:transcriptional regulator with XRE-family HTH domain
MRTSVGERIRFWRTVRQKHQVALGNAIAHSQVSISQLERGGRLYLTTEPYLSQIARYLDVPVEFLQDTGPEPTDLVNAIIRVYRWRHQRRYSRATRPEPIHV